MVHSGRMDAGIWLPFDSASIWFHQGVIVTIVSREAATTIYRMKRMARGARWIVLSTVLAVLGLLGFWVTIPVWINILLAVISFVLLFLEIRAHRRALASTEFVPRFSDSFDSVLLAVANSDRFTYRRFPHGTFLSDALVSSGIENGLEARLDAVPFSVPPRLRALSQRFLDEKTKTKHVFDGPILGWNSNVGTADSDLPSWIDFQPATYFQHIATDQLALHDVRQNDQFLEDHGRRLFIGRRGMLRDFHESWLVNVVGTSCMAFTSDGKLLIVDQGVHNLNSGGQLAPSGSGALESRDFQGRTSLPLAELAANGANRELQEESGVRPGEILESSFLGFGRWLEKAARPELVTMSLLSVDSHVLEQRITEKLERPFVRGRAFTRLVGGPGDWSSTNPEIMLDSQFRGRLSLPLSVGLALLGEFVAAGGPRAERFVAQVCASD